jgi:hypothetical protein
MLAYFQNIIRDLKDKIHKNVEEINNNQKLIQSLLSDKPDFSEHENFEKLKLQNQRLMKQNDDFINVQLILIDFIKKYKDTAILKEDIPMIDIFSVTDSEEIFLLTINNLIPFDNQHPYYTNPQFIESLITHYRHEENYEKCHSLKKIIEHLSN